MQVGKYKCECSVGFGLTLVYYIVWDRAMKTIM